MAYVSHSTAREFRVRGASPRAILALKSALIAVGAAVVILALSEASMGPSTANQMAAPFAKGDRIAAPRAFASPGSSAEFVIDAAARTTTVSKGASAPFDPGSPMAADRR